MAKKPTLSRSELRREISKLNRAVKNQAIPLHETREFSFMDGESQVLHARVFLTSVLGQSQLRLEARKGLEAEVRIHDELHEVGYVKRLMQGDSSSWVVFSLREENQVEIKFRAIESTKLRP